MASVDMPEADPRRGTVSLGRIVDALVQIPDLNDPSVRRDLLLDLPSGIRSSATTGATARGDIVNLIRACARVPDGDQELILALSTRLGTEAPDVRHALEIIQQQWPTMRSSSIVSEWRGTDGSAADAHPVDQWEPADLGVHPAVMPGITDAERRLSTLTAYVPRPHDTTVAQILPPARNAMVILWGDPATGKTRTALEAVRHHLTDWPVLRPFDADALLEHLQRDPTGGRLVIWLDRAETYLDDDRVPAALRRRLTGPPGAAGQTVVMATVETGQWRRLSGDEATGPDAGRPCGPCWRRPCPCRCRAPSPDRRSTSGGSSDGRIPASRSPVTARPAGSSRR
ncbi:hypothetical protein GCM10027610_017920 [Dactylosporangium cerinum]